MREKGVLGRFGGRKHGRGWWEERKGRELSNYILIKVLREVSSEAKAGNKQSQADAHAQYPGYHGPGGDSS